MNTLCFFPPSRVLCTYGIFAVIWKHSWFLLFAVVTFYKVATDTELVKTEFMNIEFSRGNSG